MRLRVATLYGKVRSPAPVDGLARRGSGQSDTWRAARSRWIEAAWTAAPGCCRLSCVFAGFEKVRRQIRHKERRRWGGGAYWQQRLIKQVASRHIGEAAVESTALIACFRPSASSPGGWSGASTTEPSCRLSDAVLSRPPAARRFGRCTGATHQTLRPERSNRRFSVATPVSITPGAKLPSDHSQQLARSFSAKYPRPMGRGRHFCRQ